MEKNRVLIAVLAFLTSVCSLGAMPLTNVTSTQQKTEAVNYQPGILVRSNHLYAARRDTFCGTATFVEVPVSFSALFALRQAGTTPLVLGPALPVRTHRPYI